MGTVILYIPSLEKDSKFKIDKELVRQNALWASLIQTFVLFYNVLSTDYVEEERFLNTALSCRPLLYGFCIWVILHNDEVPEEIKCKDTGISEVEEILNSGFSKEEDNITEVQGGLPGIEESRQQFLDAGLTKRETEVAILVIKCMSNAEIAEELYISETTVKKHMSNIFTKLKISKREQIRNLLH
ncbi:MAG: helix-turn-helix transcriptional regulator [Lachnospiraceae bacterium]|nr:helix-turn-helix transcriptional regulator [Lachnospiraceae bacterium]